MANMEDYIQWRGDLTLEQSPFCEADNLILSYLSYLNLEELAPKKEGETLTIRELSRLFFERYSEEELDKDKSFVRRTPYLLRAAGESARFGNAQVRNYVKIIHEVVETQFTAMEILLDDGTSYISYEGTDDTIIGWKEDFNLSNGSVAAQQAAAMYLNRIGLKTERMLRVGGHSKGGNLAIYAAAMCEPQVQQMIREVYCNDGPGFTAGFYDTEGFQNISSKVIRYIPECSIIGMLLEHRVKPHIIQSSQKGVFQHDGFSWEILGPSFLPRAELNSTAQIFDETLRSWIDGMDTHERKEFIDDFFSVLEAPGYMTLTELQNGGMTSIKAMLAQLEKINPETREGVVALIKAIAGHWPELIKSMHIEIPLLGKKGADSI